MMRRFGLLILICVAAWTAPITRLVAAYAVSSQEASVPNTPDERDKLIKAGFLYNFPKFTEWPPKAFAKSDASFRLCVVGPDPLGAALDVLDGKSVNERTLRVARLDRVDQAGGCHLVFVGAMAPDEAGKVLRALNGMPVLTVSDLPGFSDAGGMIALRTVENRVRFQINLQAARKANLKFSSKLLSLAEIATGEAAAVGQ